MPITKAKNASNSDDASTSTEVAAAVAKAQPTASKANVTLNVGEGSSASQTVANKDLTDAEKYAASVNDADALLENFDDNRSEIASRLNRDEKDLDWLSDDEIYKGLIDNYFENDYESSQSGHDMRGENWWSDIVNGISNGITDVNNNIGNGMDWVWDNTVGNIAGLIDEDLGESAKNAFTGRDLSGVVDLAEDIGLMFVPGIGWAAVGGKNAMQNADLFNRAISGIDPTTLDEISDDARITQGVTGALNTALSLVPGVGKAVNVARGVSKAGRAATEAEKTLGEAVKKSGAKLGTTEKGADIKLEGDKLTEGLPEDLRKLPLKKSNTNPEYYNPRTGIQGMTTAGEGNAMTPIQHVELSPEAAASSLSETSEDVGRAITHSDIFRENADRTIGDVAKDAVKAASKENTQEDALAAIMKTVDESLSKSLGKEGTEEVSRAIYNAMESANDATRLTALTRLGSSTRYAEPGNIVTGGLKNMGSRFASPITRRTQAMRNRTATFGDEEDKMLASLAEEGGETMAKAEGEAAGKAAEATSKPIKKLRNATAEDLENIDEKALSTGKTAVESAAKSSAAEGGEVTKAAEAAAQDAAEEAAGELPGRFMQTWRAGVLGKDPVTGLKMPSAYNRASQNVAQEALDKYINKNLSRKKLGGKIRTRRTKAAEEATERAEEANKALAASGRAEQTAQTGTEYDDLINDLINAQNRQKLYGQTINDVNGAGNTLKAIGNFAGRTAANQTAGLTSAIMNTAAATNQNPLEAMTQIANGGWEAMAPYVVTAMAPGSGRLKNRTGVGLRGIRQNQVQSVPRSAASTALAQGDVYRRWGEEEDMTSGPEWDPDLYAELLASRVNQRNQVA